jgi:hypothetical protein
VLEFHRFKQVMTAAGQAKDQLKRQLERVLTSQTAEMLPAASQSSAPSPPKKRLSGLKRFARKRSL